MLQGGTHLIKTIVIVGGGTAGWATAHQFIKGTTDIEVIVVSSPDVPIVGVGESTTGIFNELINTITDEKEFLRETQSTFKIGIKHSDWDEVGKSFLSPLGDSYHSDFNYPSEDYDNVRIYHVANGMEYNKSFQSRLMDTDRLHFHNGEGVYNYDSPDSIPLAYHLDTYLTGEYLKKIANCKYIEGKVDAFAQDNRGFINHLILDDGRIVKGDLFIDCSGFSRILIDNIEPDNFVSYEDELLVDSAIVYNREYDKDETIKGYTHAHALKYGWKWEIPTQTRMGCGYVYSSKFVDKDKAYEEIKPVDVLNHIKFNSGRLKKQWCKNVIATGLASGFLEPLEATSIHVTVMQIAQWLSNYFKPTLDLNVQSIQDQYNEDMAYMWDNLKDFIVFHYISRRRDTDFWIQSSSPERWSPRLTRLVDIWKYRMPRTTDFIIGKSNNFHAMGNPLWYHIAIGMNMLDSDIARQELEGYGLYKQTEDHCNKVYGAVEKILPDMMKTNDYYQHI